MNRKKRGNVREYMLDNKFVARICFTTNPRYSFFLCRPISVKGEKSKGISLVLKSENKVTKHKAKECLPTRITIRYDYRSIILRTKILQIMATKLFKISITRRPRFTFDILHQSCILLFMLSRKKYSLVLSFSKPVLKVRRTGINWKYRRWFFSYQHKTA